MSACGIHTLVVYLTVKILMRRLKKVTAPLLFKGLLSFQKDLISTLRGIGVASRLAHRAKQRATLWSFPLLARLLAPCTLLCDLYRAQVINRFVWSRE